VPPGAYTTTIRTQRPIKAAASCETGFMHPARLSVCRVVISPWYVAPPGAGNCFSGSSNKYGGADIPGRALGRHAA
jgi:hypothetical protein